MRAQVAVVRIPLVAHSLLRADLALEVVSLQMLPQIFAIEEPFVAEIAPGVFLDGRIATVAVPLVLVETALVVDELLAEEILALAEARVAEMQPVLFLHVLAQFFQGFEGDLSLGTAGIETSIFKEHLNL